MLTVVLSTLGGIAFLVCIGTAIALLGERVGECVHGVSTDDFCILCTPDTPGEERNA